MDIGCGLGDFLLCLKERGFRDITGFDHSEIAVRFAQKCGLNIIQGSIDCDEDVAKLPKDNDIIIMGDILEHIFAPKRIILKAREILKPNGILIISVPNVGWFINGILLSFFPKYYKVSPAFGSWTHLNQYTFWLLTRQLELCGFHVERSSGVTHCRYEARSRKFWENATCIAMDLVFVMSGLLAKIKASIFSPHIVVLARRDEALPIEEDYFMKE